LNKFLHTLNHMLVELYGSDGPLGDGGHLGLGDGGLHLVQGGHLLVERLHCLHD